MITSSARDADVIVVGGGPAGSVTALLLARAGYDVLVLDRSRFPRAKPCGDCVSAGATELLQRLGVLSAIAARPHALLRGWRIVAPDGRMFEASFADAREAFAIERSELDDALLSAAHTCGVRVVTDRVTDLLRSDDRVCGVRTRSGSLLAPIVVGADGLRSVVAARLGPRRRIGPLRKLSLTWHVDVTAAAPGLGEMHSGDGFCAGLAPVSGTRSNLTFVADATRFGRTIASDPARAAAALMRKLPRLAGRIDETILLRAAPLASGPFDRPAARIAVAGAVLVGDAAGYYDPFTGQGIFQAMAAAELLAPCIDRALRNGRSDRAVFADYVRGHERLTRGARVVQRGIEAVLSRPALAARAIERIAAAPAFARALIAVTGDVAPPSSLLSPRALSSLILPLPETT